MSFAFLPLYTGDYLRDTQHLSCSEHGVFLKLLIHCWDQRGPVPLDERKQTGITNARSGDEIEALRRVLGEFFVRMEDGWYNHRMQMEVERANAISAGRSAAGKLGYQAKAKQLLSKSQASVKHVPLPSPPPPHLQPPPQPEEQKIAAPPAAVLVRCDAPDPSRYVVPDCPYAEIIAGYHSWLPRLPKVKIANQKRKDLIRGRWREVCAAERWGKDDALEFFGNFFAKVARSKFLTGRTQQKGREPFVADLEWLMRPTNFAKTLEGRYEETEA